MKKARSTPHVTSERAPCMKRSFSMDDICFITPISKGKYGEVHRIKVESREYAMKQFFTDESTPQDVVREYRMMKKCKHPNVVNVEFLVDDESKNLPRIVMELCSTVEHRELSYQERVRLMIDVATAVRFMHEKCGVVHGDIKPQNVVESSKKYKICDFGSARELGDFTNDLFLGTPLFLAPEMCKRVRYPKLLDVYSFGILMWDLWSSESIFDNLKGLEPFDLVWQTSKGFRPRLDKLRKSTPKRIRKLIVKCWDQDPLKRPQSFTGILSILNKLQDFT